ncbi:hypothetical protein PALB_15030 [Pseudoalteromonas luteoviolacea B = ATCC 29581]|nr:hypothetical protein PALB_15030 [Pseudoalteromonas luteoviolacea B = ATCC 29581]
MDVMAPYLGKIVRLDVQHQQAFAIAGVVGNRVEAIKKRREKQLELLRKNQKNQENISIDEKELYDDETHLDIWA